MIQSKVNDHITLILNKMFSNQTAYVSFNSSYSEAGRIGNGCRQGAVNSPLLFNFYLNKLVTDVLNTNIGCKLAFQPYNILAYADDIVLLAPTQSGLQLLLNNVNNHLNKLCLQLNVEKSKIMLFKSPVYIKINYLILILNLALTIRV